MVITIPTVVNNLKQSKQKAFNIVAETMRKYLVDNYENCKLGNGLFLSYDDKIFDQSNNCSLIEKDLSENLIKNSGYSTNDIKEVKVTQTDGNFTLEVQPNENGKFKGVLAFKDWDVSSGERYVYLEVDEDFEVECWDISEVGVSYSIKGFKGINYEIGEIKENCTRFVSKDGDGYALNIPKKIDGKKVIKIGCSAFSGDGHTYEGKNNLSYSSYNPLIIPSSVKTIGEKAFANNNLIKIKFSGASTAILG